MVEEHGRADPGRRKGEGASSDRRRKTGESETKIFRAVQRREGRGTGEKKLSALTDFGVARGVPAREVEIKGAEDGGEGSEGTRGRKEGRLCGVPFFSCPMHLRAS